MNAGLIQGDRILSVSSKRTEVTGLTEVTGFGGDQLTAVLIQTWKASALAGGSMLLQMQRSVGGSVHVFYAELFAGVVPDDDPFVELERLLVQAEQSGDLAEMRSLTDAVNAKLAELEKHVRKQPHDPKHATALLKIQEEKSKQRQLEIAIEKSKQQHLQLEIRKASSQYPVLTFTSSVEQYSLIPNSERN